MRKSFRVKKEADFQKVFETHNSVANRQFVVYTLEKPQQPHFRVGISVGKRIGNAVHRNWVKRRVRRSIYELKDQLPKNMDFIVIARPSTDQMAMVDVKKSLIHVLKLAKLIKSNDDSGGLTVKKRIKKITFLLSMLSLTIFLAACSNTPITEHSKGIWDGLIVLNFSRAIIWLSKAFNDNYGIGIILFTIAVRIVILPLMIYQTRSMQKTQEVQPQLKALQKKYSSKDTETMQKLQTEQRKLYSEAGVNPIAGCLPLIIQMPIIYALYAAILRTQLLKSGDFLWLKLGLKDPYFILPILAAIFTFLSSWLSMKSQPESTSMTTMMTIGMPVIIFFTAINLPSALSLYWVITNAFQAGQTLVIQNPWKIKRQREKVQAEQKQKQRAVKKAVKRAKRSKRK